MLAALQFFEEYSLPPAAEALPRPHQTVSRKIHNGSLGACECTFRKVTRYNTCIKLIIGTSG